MKESDTGQELLAERRVLIPQLIYVLYPEKTSACPVFCSRAADYPV
jgi:hypothetical protein